MRRAGLILAALLTILAVTACGSKTQPKRHTTGCEPILRRHGCLPSRADGGSGAPTYTPTVYVAQTAAGSGNASSCANAEGVATLNANTHSDWSAGNVIGLCGAITSEITAAGSGTRSRPIVVYWEPNAKMSLSAASCTGTDSSCFDLSGASYVTLDGGANGVLQVTDNGDKSAHNYPIRGIQLGGSGNTIEYMTIKNIYVKHYNTEVSTNAVGIWSANATNFTIDRNTLSQAGNEGLIITNSQATASMTISNNDISGDNWAIASADSTSAAQGPIYIFGNRIHDLSNWDDPSDANHHNGIFCYTSGGTTYDPPITFYIYNNLFSGDPGAHATSWVDIQGCSNDTSAYNVFNNIFASEKHDPANGDDNANQAIDNTYNNTFVGSGGGSLALLYMRNTGHHDIRNNILWNGSIGEPSRSGCGGSAPTGYPCPTYSLNNNMYANSLGGDTTTFDCPPNNTQYSWSGGWSHWVSCIRGVLNTNPGPGADETDSFGPPGSSRTVTNPGLDSNYDLKSGSAALGAGQNLYSICSGQPNPGLGALCDTYAGPTPSGRGAGPNGQWTTPTARPGSGPWNMGAY